MKSIFNILLLTILLIGTASADTRYRGRAVHPDYPGQCYYKELKQPIPVNQSFYPINMGYCESFYCRDDFVLEIGICGRHNMVETDTCKIVTDNRKPYPECCPRYECQEDQDNMI